MIDSKFLFPLANCLFHARLINSTMFHRSKSVLSNSCICLNHIREYFSKFRTIFQHPLWLLLSPTLQTVAALGVPRVNIHFISLSGVVDLMYYRNDNFSLLTWTSNNQKGVGPYWHRSKTLSWSKHLSASVRISELIDPLGNTHIRPGTYFPLNLHTGNPVSYFPYPIFSSIVLLDSYGIDAR